MSLAPRPALGGQEVPLAISPSVLCTWAFPPTPHTRGGATTEGSSSCSSRRVPHHTAHVAYQVLTALT